MVMLQTNYRLFDAHPRTVAFKEPRAKSDSMSNTVPSFMSPAGFANKCI